MLAKVGVLTDAERDDIIQGLSEIKAEIEAGRFEWRIDLEDVHMNIESRLTQRIGITGKNCTPAAAVTTKSLPTFACTYAMKLTIFCRFYSACKRAC